VLNYEGFERNWQPRLVLRLTDIELLWFDNVELLGVPSTVVLKWVIWILFEAFVAVFWINEVYDAASLSPPSLYSD
jgi:hypothetical protein